MAQVNGQGYAPLPTMDIDEVPHLSYTGTELFDHPSELHQQPAATVVGIPVPNGLPPQYPGTGGAPGGPNMGVMRPGSYPTGSAHPQPFMSYPGQVQNVAPQPVNGAVATPPQLPHGFRICRNQTTFTQRWTNTSIFIISLISIALSVTLFVTDVYLRAQEARARQSGYDDYDQDKAPFSVTLLLWMILSLACSAFSLFVGEDFEVRFDDMARFITVIKRPLAMRLCCCFPCERGYGVSYNDIAAVEFVFGHLNQSAGGLRLRRRYTKRSWVAFATLITGQKVHIGVFAGVPTDASWFPVYQAFLSQRLPQAQVVHPASTFPLVDVENL